MPQIHLLCFDYKAHVLLSYGMAANVLTFKKLKEKAKDYNP